MRDEITGLASQSGTNERSVAIQFHLSFEIVANPASFLSNRLKFKSQLCPSGQALYDVCEKVVTNADLCNLHVPFDAGSVLISSNIDYQKV